MLPTVTHTKIELNVVRVKLVSQRSRRVRKSWRRGGQYSHRVMPENIAKNALNRNRISIVTLPARLLQSQRVTHGPASPPRCLPIVRPETPGLVRTQRLARRRHSMAHDSR